MIKTSSYSSKVMPKEVYYQINKLPIKSNLPNYHSIPFRRKYSVPRTTNALKVTYYVKDNFHSEYSGSLGRLEATVEEEFLSNLKHSCYRERNYSKWWIMHTGLASYLIRIHLEIV